MPTLSHCINKTPLALGNPAHSRVLNWEVIDEDEDDLMMCSCSVEGWIARPGEEELADSGFTSFLYQADKERYGPAHLITVRYFWNRDEADCIENEVLLEKSHLDVPTFRRKIFKTIKDSLPVDLLQIRTINGALEIAEFPKEMSNPKAYPLIPNSLGIIPWVTISCLRKCLVKALHRDIDIVTRHEDLGPCQQWYVFKRYALSLEQQERPMDDLLSEVEYMTRIDSPYIMKPSFLVTDDSHSLFHGFLMPLMPAGTLRNVFQDLAEGSSNSSEPMFLHPKHVKPFKPRDFDKEVKEDAIKPSTPQLSWPIKHRWAIEATSGLVALHQSGVYTGDIKLDNILLDRDGHLQHIDVAPQTRGYTLPYMAPEFNIPNDDDLAPLPCHSDDEPESDNPPSSLFPLTESRDIFAFGLVLWQIAEEETTFMREDTSKSPELTWRSCNLEGATHLWYRNLVVRCVDSDPEKRPSAKDILDVLESNL